ncbi:MAG: hypothetical protein ABL931_01020 [Usitatibacteraceae bacterium]
MRAKLFVVLATCVLLANFAYATSAANEPSSAPDPAHAIAGTVLLEALRKGGYTLYFRHTSTDFSKLDGPVKQYDDCSTQRMLSEKGRDEAKRIGAEIHTLKSPVGEVLASPYCRTVETAMLMFGRAQKANAVREGAQENYPELRTLLAKRVPPGNGNRVIVGHGTPFRAIAGAPHLGEGEAAVLKPLGDRYIVIARIAIADWAVLREHKAN